jgi:biopolymer transport protein ExbB/TolQ
VKRTLFLKWTLVQVLFVSALGAAASCYHGHVHVAGKAAAAAVLVVYALASANAGWIAWRDPWSADDFKHIDLAIKACPMLALLGTVSGFLIAFSGDAADVQQRVLGASTGLIATFIGISAALVLMLQRHLLDA